MSINVIHCTILHGSGEAGKVECI